MWITVLWVSQTQGILQCVHRHFAQTCTATQIIPDKCRLPRKAQHLAACFAVLQSLPQPQEPCQIPIQVGEDEYPIPLGVVFYDARTGGTPF